HNWLWYGGFLVIADYCVRQGLRGTEAAVPAPVPALRPGWAVGRASRARDRPGLPAGKPSVVGPGLDHPATGPGPPLQEAVQAVLVRALRPHRLARGEVEGRAADVHVLRPQADQVHLDPAAAGVIGGEVAEAVQVEVAAQLAVDPRQQVQVEGR